MKIQILEQRDVDAWRWLCTRWRRWGAKREPAKQSEISNSGKPLSLQAGGRKGGGGIRKAQRQSHLKETGGPVGLSGWLEL